MASKVAIEHRPVVIPGPTLTSPKVTSHKILAEGQCRMCGREAYVRPLTRHHLVPVSWFIRQPQPMRVIRNAHANIVPLCRPCHDLIDKEDDDTVRMRARRELRRSLGQVEIAFVIQVMGKEWLDTEYPKFDTVPRPASVGVFASRT